MFKLFFIFLFSFLIHPTKVSSECFWSKYVSLSVVLNFHIFVFFSRTTGLISTSIGQSIQIQIYSNEGLCPFPKEDDNGIIKVHWQPLKHLQNRYAILKHDWHKVFLGGGNSSLFNKKTNPFAKKIILKYWKYIEHSRSSREPLGQIQPNF